MESFSFSEQLNTYLKDKNDIKIFDLLKHEINPKCIGRGGFAIVYSVTIEEKNYALKSFKQNAVLYKDEFKEFMRELKMLYMVNEHPNVIKFYGISQNVLSEDYTLVLQLANGGNLRDHLLNKQKGDIYSILWSELMRIAIDIIEGLKHLHNNNIIHRDLHSKNILINDGRALISDFGISKRIDASTVTSGVKGMVAYIDLQRFLQFTKCDEQENIKRHNQGNIRHNNQENTKRDKKSTIYSLGVLLWELTSGVPPFNKYPQEIIITKLLNREKEGPIYGTPKIYTDIYTNCWSFEPNLRPNLDDISKILVELFKQPADFIIQNKVDDLSNYLDRLFSNFADLTNKGLEFSQIYRRIENIIIEENQTTKNTFDCLRNKENNNNSDWLCLLGFFHLEGIGTEKNQKVAHSTFQKAKNGNTKGNFMAKFYLGECLRNGYGAKRNLESAKLLYEDIESECARAANSLGLCYLKGIRYRTKKKAIEWFEKSYKKGCISACNNLGNCYQFGRGTKKDEKKAFQYYLEAAEYGIIVGQYNTAECFRKGTGTKKDLDSAKQRYNKSAVNGHKNAMNKLNSINKVRGSMRQYMKSACFFSGISHVKS